MNLIIIGHFFKYELESLANMFFREDKVRVVYEDHRRDGDYLYTEVCPDQDGVFLMVSSKIEGKAMEDSHYLAKKEENWEKAQEYHLCRMLYQQLSRRLGFSLAWGMLTGVRPVRLIYRYRERGMSDDAIRAHLMEDYFVSAEKVALLLQTAKREKPILDLSRPESYSLYISIPFCPSRCHYCSFVSHSVASAKKLIPEYIKLLKEEIAYTAALLRPLELRLETVYFGGGTPTAISAQQLEEIICAVKEHFDLTAIREFTVEAGRPDTITNEKLEMLLRQGATRISINPQTMNDSVLEKIGRNHTASQTVEAFAAARKAGHQNINMDLIAGLDGDTLDSFQATVDQVLLLAPENITVHTLSVKRSSRLGHEKSALNRLEHEKVSDMLRYAGEKLSQAGYAPYYLYRQKNTMENMENVGYCKEGKDGFYNVYIMDETHSIVALGAGAVSKLRKPGGSLLHRIFNFKYPYEYIGRFEQVLKRKDEIVKFYADGDQSGKIPCPSKQEGV